VVKERERERERERKKNRISLNIDIWGTTHAATKVCGWKYSDFGRENFFRC
jgi:hypothetical protein